MWPADQRSYKRQRYNGNFLITQPPEVSIMNHSQPFLGQHSTETPGASYNQQQLYITPGVHNSLLLSAGPRASAALPTKVEFIFTNQKMKNLEIDLKHNKIFREITFDSSECKFFKKVVAEILRRYENHKLSIKSSPGNIGEYDRILKKIDELTEKLESNYANLLFLRNARFYDRFSFIRFAAIKEKNTYELKQIEKELARLKQKTSSNSQVYSILETLPRDVIKEILCYCKENFYNIRRSSKLMCEVISNIFPVIITDYNFREYDLSVKQKNCKLKLSGLVITRPIGAATNSTYVIKEKEFFLENWPENVPKHAYIVESSFVQGDFVSRVIYSIFDSLPDVVIHVPWVFDSVLLCEPGRICHYMKHYKKMQDKYKEFGGEYGKFEFYRKKIGLDKMVQYGEKIKTNILDFIKLNKVHMINHEEYDKYLCEFLRLYFPGEDRQNNPFIKKIISALEKIPPELLTATRNYI